MYIVFGAYMAVTGLEFEFLVVMYKAFWGLLLQDVNVI